MEVFMALITAGAGLVEGLLHIAEENLGLSNGRNKKNN